MTSSAKCLLDPIEAWSNHSGGRCLWRGSFHVRSFRHDAGVWDSTLLIICCRKSPRFYHWRSFLIRNVYLLLSTLVFFVLEVWQCLTTWFGRQLKSLCPGGIVVAERDGHAIARISPGATFGECLGHEIILNYELLWAGLTLYCGFRMKWLSFHVDRLAMLGVSPVCNSDWQSCYNETIASLIGVKR